MNQNIELNCDACGFHTTHLATMNRHLVKCDKYEEWIKTYKPPKGYECLSCNKVFITEEIYNKHVFECYIK